MKGGGSFWRKLVVPDSSMPLERQFFQRICLLSGLISLFVVIPMNAFQHLSPWVNSVLLVYGLISLASSWAVIRGHYPKGLMILALVAGLDLTWFANGGSQGSIGLYFFSAALLVALFLEGKLRYLALGLLLLDIIGLHLAEQAWPQWVHPFEGARERLLDLLTGYVISLLFCVLIVQFILSGLGREKTRLAESERMYREFLEHQGEGFAILEAAGQFQLVNPVAEEIFGVAHGGLAGRNLMEFIPADQQDLVLEESMHRSHGRRTTYEHQIRRDDGSIRTLLVTATPGSSHEGTVFQVIAVFRDITERKDAEDRVRESEERYRNQFNYASEGLFTHTPEGDILEVNEAMARMHGYTREEMLGMNLRDLDVPESAKLLPSRLSRILAGEVLTFEVEHIHKSGHVFPLEVSASLISAGKRPTVLCFHRDITERKRNEEMERLLVQEKQQNQKMESLGRLAGGVAHDFNNMLCGILANADLLLEGTQDPKHLKYLRVIKAASSRSAELTQKLLAFARRGKNLLEPIDLGALVEDCLDLIRPSMSPNIRLRVAMEGCPSIDGDPAQIHQVVMNLCINAIEAMPEQGILSLAAKVCAVSEASHPGVELPAGAYVEISVADTGVGMTEEVQQRIFEPFFTTKNSAGLGGTGLGLATTYGIAQAHGGAIAVDSRPGQGSTFHVFLPVGSLPRAERVVPVNASLGGGLVLLVEDEPLLREVGTSALEALGFEVATASDGVEAVEAYQRCHAQLCAVLLDLKMPRKAGRETFLEIHAIDPGVPGPGMHGIRRERGSAGTPVPGRCRAAGQALHPCRAGRQAQAGLELTQARRPERGAAPAFPSSAVWNP